MKLSSTPWWMTETYDVEANVPDEFDDLSGPLNVALVRAWPDGRTDQGWGLMGPKSDPDNGFMPRYLNGQFLARRVLHGFDRDRWAFAFVMRSRRLVCIDIDGKNGGFDHAGKLGPLPPTLAETSKSGNGYHLFYKVDERWDVDKGYGLLADRIGIEQGVDIRSTGCVYHHKSQRWNRRTAAMLPDHILEKLLHREQKIEAQYARIDTVLASNDPLEILMMQDQLIDELNKPITQGKRNNTLFAIGNQMRQGQVPDWEQLVSDRAVQVGLDGVEIDSLITNITRYGK
jgi:hypothetical protein